MFHTCYDSPWIFLSTIPSCLNLFTLFLFPILLCLISPTLSSFLIPLCLFLRYNISIMEHETRKNFNQFQQEPELHTQNRNQGPEIPQLSRSAAYQERQFQRHLQSELNKKRENEPALDTVVEKLTYLAAMAAPTIGRAALLAIGTGLAVKGVSVLANHLSNQSIEQHQKDMEELGVPLEYDEEDDYNRTFTGYEDYMNHHNALRAQKGLEPDYTPENGPIEYRNQLNPLIETSQASSDTENSAYSIQLNDDMQKFTPDNNLTIPEEKIADDTTSINTNATQIEHRTAITLQDEKLAHIAEKTILKTVNFPAGIGQFKSFMDYKAITDKTTPNYNFTHENANFHVGKSGLTYYQDGKNTYPVVAVGSGISDKIGQLIEITLDNQGHSNILRCVIGDQKDDGDTDPTTHTVHKNDHSVVEFLVDYDRLKEANPTAVNMGDLTYLDNSQFNLKGNVTKVQVLDQNFYSNENQ